MSRSRSALRSKPLTSTLILMLFALPVTTLTHVPDGQCYLQDGSSSASFTVSEELPPGEVIGALEVKGNSTEHGDIVLTLLDDRSLHPGMVRIVPDTKLLVLTGKLDKENRDGPSQLQIKVKCEKKNSNDPAIIIPVRIVVQDANDNAPVFVNAPYVLQLRESMSPGMVISSDMIRAYDGDQPGPFSTIQYSVEPGPFSSFLSFQSALAPTLVIKKQLDYETLPNFTVTIKAQDQGQPPLFNTTTITIMVLDADDQNPRFANQSYFAILPSTVSPGDLLEVGPAPIYAEDQDRGLNVPVYYTFESDTPDSKYFEIDSLTGNVSLRTAIPADMFFSVTLVVRATQLDNEDRRDLTTLTIVRNPVFTGLRFLSTSYQLSVPENLPVGNILLQLPTNRPFDEYLRFSLIDDFDGQFDISNSGDLILAKPLDFEKTEKMDLEVNVSSGDVGDVAKVELTVLDVNEHDPTFGSALYRFRVTAAVVEKRQPIGHIVTRDEDRDDIVALTLMGANANAFYVDSSGEVFVKNASLLNFTVTHLMVMAIDSGTPPRRSSVPLEVLVSDDVLAVASVLTVDSNFFVMVVFGVSLAILFVVIVVLSIHIVKRKRQLERVGQAPIFPNHQPLAKMASYMTGGTFAHQKLASDHVGGSSSDNENDPVQPAEIPSPPRQSQIARRGVENPIFQESPSSHRCFLANGHASSKVSSRESTASSDDGKGGLTDCGGTASVTSPGIQSPPVGRPPCLPPRSQACACSDDVMDLDATEVLENGKRFAGFANGNLALKRSSMKVQPDVGETSSTSIPKRVKKLSWEDEHRQKTIVMDPDVSVVPFVCKHGRSMDTPDLAAYF